MKQTAASTPNIGITVRAVASPSTSDRVPATLYGELIGYVPAVAELLEAHCGPVPVREHFGLDITSVAVAPSRHPVDAAGYIPVDEHTDVDEEIINAILGHAEYSGTPRVTAMQKCLFAVDEPPMLALQYFLSDAIGRHIGV